MSFSEQLVYMLVAGFLANNVWRWAGVVASRGLDENSEIVRWVRAVATALVAGLVAKIVLFPSGDLALVPQGLRVGALAAAVVAYFAFRRSVIAGVAAGEIVLIGGNYAGLYWL